MKTYVLVVLVMLMTVTEVMAAISINKISQWPYSSALPYLQPSPNSVATGAHSGYAEGIVIWAVGDSISVINAADLIEITSFQVNTQNAIRDLYYNENSETLYLALGTNGLQIYDFSTLPPTRVGDGYSVSDADPGYQLNLITRESEETFVIDAMGIGYHEKMVDGDLEKQIFLTDNNFGLRVIDVTDRAAPEEVTFDTPIQISLGYEWVDNQTTGIPEYEETFLTRTSGYIQPNVIGSYDVTGGYNNIEVIPFDGKTYAFVHDYYYGLSVFDVTDPTDKIDSPVSKFLATQGWFQYNSLLNDIYVAVGPDYDTVNPTNRLYAYVTAVTNIGTTVAMRLDVLSEDNVLVSEIIDGEDVTSITNIGRRVTDGNASGVYVKGDHVFVADGPHGLEIIDISTGEPVHDDTPVLNYLEVASYDTSDTVDMNVLSLVGDDDGDTLYLHDALGGLHEIGVTVNAHNVVATSYERTIPPPVSGDSVAVDGDFAYCLDSDDGLRIFNISEPTVLSLESFHAGTGNDIAVNGNYAYIAKGSDGLEIVNVTTKTAPEQTDLIDTSGSAVAVDVYENGATKYACVVNSATPPGTFGFAVINVSDPDSVGAPQVIVDLETETVNDVTVYGNYAYLANKSEGLQIVKLSEGLPDSVTATKAIAGGIATAVSVYDDGTAIYALLAVDGTIIIEKVTNLNSTSPINIESIGTIDPEVSYDDNGDPIESGEADVESFVGIDVLNNYLFAASGSDGVYVYDISEPSEPRVFIGKYETSSPVKEVVPFNKDEDIYFASAEDINGIAVYNLNFGTPPSEPLGDTGDEIPGCFITSLEY